MADESFEVRDRFNRIYDVIYQMKEASPNSIDFLRKSALAVLYIEGWTKEIRDLLNPPLTESETVVESGK